MALTYEGLSIHTVRHRCYLLGLVQSGSMLCHTKLTFVLHPQPIDIIRHYHQVVLHRVYDHVIGDRQFDHRCRLVGADD